MRKGQFTRTRHPCSIRLGRRRALFSCAQAVAARSGVAKRARSYECLSGRGSVVRRRTLSRRPYSGTWRTVRSPPESWRRWSGRPDRRRWRGRRGGREQGRDEAAAVHAPGAPQQITARRFPSAVPFWTGTAAIRGV
jgi:hypothetical protein